MVHPRKEHGVLHNTFLNYYEKNIGSQCKDLRVGVM